MRLGWYCLCSSANDLPTIATSGSLKVALGYCGSLLRRGKNGKAKRCTNLRPCALAE